MKASVIIATYNRCHTLRRTIPTLFAQRFRAEDLEIIIVVDGSSDGSSEYLRSVLSSSPFAMTIIEQENRGQHAALNRGAARANGNLILFLDDDCYCAPDLLCEHIKAHGASSRQNIVVGPAFVSENSPSSLGTDLVAEVEAQNYDRLVKMGPSLHDMMLCANSSISRSAFLATGGFDEKLLRNSDIEIGIRLAKMGLGVKFCPTAIVRQMYSKSDRQLVECDMRYGGAAELAIVRKHPDYKRRSQLARLGAEPWWIARQIAGRLPFAPEPLLRALYRAVSPFRSFQWGQALGMGLLKARMACAFYRSAAHAAGSWKTLESEFGKRLPILMYHHIGEPRRGAYPELTTSVPDFERQIRWLARHGYSSIKAADWLAWCSEGGCLPRKPVLLSFDDAYEETAKNAVPILRANGFTGTFMVVTNYIGKTNVWDELQGRPSFAIMSEDQILKQRDHCIEYGAHSRSHPELTKVSDAELRDELQGSRDALEAILHSPIRCFAYPYADHDRRVRQCAATYFDMAFTTEPRINHLSSDPHRLGRISFSPTDAPFGMWCRMQFGWSPLPRLLGYVKRRFSRISGRRRSDKPEVAS